MRPVFVVDLSRLRPMPVAPDFEPVRDGALWVAVGDFVKRREDCAPLLADCGEPILEMLAGGR